MISPNPADPLPLMLEINADSSARLRGQKEPGTCLVRLSLSFTRTMEPLDAVIPPAHSSFLVLSISAAPHSYPIGYFAIVNGTIRKGLIYVWD